LTKQLISLFDHDNTNLEKLAVWWRKRAMA